MKKIMVISALLIAGLCHAQPPLVGKTLDLKTSLKFGNYQVTGISNDSTGTTLSATKLITEWAVKKLVVSRFNLLGNVSLINTNASTTQFLRGDGTWQTISAGGGTWGSITGTLSSQTDLQTALGLKEDVSNKSTSTALGTSNTLYPSQNAVKTYVDVNAVSVLDTLNSGTAYTTKKSRDKLRDSVNASFIPNTGSNNINLGARTLTTTGGISVGGASTGYLSVSSGQYFANFYSTSWFAPLNMYAVDGTTVGFDKNFASPLVNTSQVASASGANMRITSLNNVSGQDCFILNNAITMASPLSTTRLLSLRQNSNEYFAVEFISGQSYSPHGFKSPLFTGGDAAGSYMTYKSTSGTGTTTGIAHQFTGGTNGGTIAATILNDGRIGAGTASPVACAKLEVASTTQGVLLPRMTTTQKNAISSPAEGLEVYDLTLHQKSYYNGTTWVNY